MIAPDAAASADRVELPPEYPAPRGSVLGTMQPRTDQAALVASMPQASDKDGRPSPKSDAPYLVAIAIILMLALSHKHWRPHAVKSIAWLRTRAEAIIIIGLACAIFDWRVLPNLLEDGTITDLQVAIWHADGWLMMGAMSIALLGLYWKMRFRKD